MHLFDVKRPNTPSICQRQNWNQLRQRRRGSWAENIFSLRVVLLSCYRAFNSASIKNEFGGCCKLPCRGGLPGGLACPLRWPPPFLMPRDPRRGTRPSGAAGRRLPAAGRTGVHHPDLPQLHSRPGHAASKIAGVLQRVASQNCSRAEVAASERFVDLTQTCWVLQPKTFKNSSLFKRLAFN